MGGGHAVEVAEDSKENKLAKREAELRQSLQKNWRKEGDQIGSAVAANVGGTTMDKEKVEELRKKLAEARAKEEKSKELRKKQKDGQDWPFANEDFSSNTREASSDSYSSYSGSSQVVPVVVAAPNG